MGIVVMVTASNTLVNQLLIIDRTGITDITAAQTKDIYYMLCTSDKNKPEP